MNLCLNDSRRDERLLSYFIDTTLTGKEDGSSNDALQELAADTLWEYFRELDVGVTRVNLTL